MGKASWRKGHWAEAGRGRGACRSAPIHHLLLAPAGDLTPDPQRGPTVAGGVERRPGQQPLRCEEPFPRLDFRSVCQRPLGPLPLQLSPAGELAQALPHCPQLCLALRLHAAAVRDASGGPEVRDPYASLCFVCFTICPLTFLFYI